MQLTGELFIQLQDALVAAYASSYLRLAQFVSQKMEYDLAKICPDTRPIDIVARELIGWANTNSRLGDLICKAYADRSDNSQMSDFYLAYLECRSAVPDDPFTICWFPHKRCFVNRRRLRDLLRDLKTQTSRRGLVIVGDPRTGKSYSRDLIDYLENDVGGFQSIYIDLSRYEKYQADQIARRILRVMGEDVELPTLQTSDSVRRWAADLAEIIFSKAAKSRKVWWIVLDEFRKAALQPGVMELAEELAELLAVGSPPLRLILVDYHGTIPASVKSRFDQETVGSLTRTDVFDFFRLFFNLHGGADEPTIDAVTTAVWSLGSPAGAATVESISTGIEQKVQDLLRARAKGVA